MLGLNLNYVSKTGPMCLDMVSNNWSRYACALTNILLDDNLQQKYIKQSVNVNSTIKLHAYKLSESPLVANEGQDLTEIGRLA